MIGVPICGTPHLSTEAGTVVGGGQDRSGLVETMCGLEIMGHDK